MGRFAIYRFQLVICDSLLGMQLILCNYFYLKYVCNYLCQLETIPTNTRHTLLGCYWRLLLI